MAASTAGKLFSALCSIRCTTTRGVNWGYPQTCTFLQSRNYAARKGTREKARKKKVKVIVEKIGFIPHNQRNFKKSILSINKVRFDDVAKQKQPEDDVWIGKYHQIKVYPFAEAIQCHKETHSMGMFDKPDAYVKAMVELDMTGAKPTKPVTKFSRLAAVPHPFDHGETRTLIAFAQTPELQKEALKAGATKAGGSELISQLQSGEINAAEYSYAIAHPNMMADLVVVKGLLKKKFPSAINDSLGTNIAEMVKKFIHGIKYSGQPHECQPLYGKSEVIFGKLSMETKELEENFAAVIAHMNSYRPKRPGPFIWRIFITTELSREFLKVDEKLYTSDKGKKDEDEDDEDDDDDAAPVSAAI